MTGPNVSQVTEKFRAIPKETKRKKVWSTVIGIGVAVIGGLLVRAALTIALDTKEVPYVLLVLGLVILLFAGIIASGEIVLYPARKLVALYRDYVLAKKGGEG